MNRYYGREEDIAGAKPEQGVLLVNLGTPDAPDARRVKPYLREFLSDPRVVELPAALWKPLLYGLVVNLRAGRSAQAYRAVWTEEGSPLMLNSERLADALGRELGDAYRVKLAMRYGAPSVESALRELHDAGCRDVVAIPLYPQYSATTSGAVFDAIATTLSKQRWVPALRFVSQYCRRPQYISALAERITQHWTQHGRAQRLLLSFHGIPERYVTSGDPYAAECRDSAERLAAELDLAPSDWMLVFQSRLGRAKWLTPYCDQTLRELPAQGIETVDIVCPGFATDCLETLEEIAIENRQIFLDAGGSEYRYIPCLNAADGHVALFADIVRNP